MVSRLIAASDKFQFPVGYFDIDLEQDLNVYKIVFSTLNDSWKRINNNINYNRTFQYRNNGSV